MKTINELSEQYPQLFENCFDFSIGEGWKPLIQEFLNFAESLALYVKKDDSNDYERISLIPYLSIHQIKEKFGGLRIYYGYTSIPDNYLEQLKELKRDLFGVERFMEWKSFRVCEACGQPGKPTKGGWVQTLCETHSQSKG